MQRCLQLNRVDVHCWLAPAQAGRHAAAPCREERGCSQIAAACCCCVRNHILTVQLPPHVLFDLLADPNQHERIFDEIVVSSGHGNECTTADLVQYACLCLGLAVVGLGNNAWCIALIACLGKWPLRGVAQAACALLRTSQTLCNSVAHKNECVDATAGLLTGLCHPPLLCTSISCLCALHHAVLLSGGQSSGSTHLTLVHVAIVNNSSCCYSVAATAALLAPSPSPPPECQC